MCAGAIVGTWIDFNPWESLGYRPTMTVLLGVILVLVIMWDERRKA
jgi:hypothetical protein